MVKFSMVAGLSHTGDTTMCCVLEQDTSSFALYWLNPGKDVYWDVKNHLKIYLCYVHGLNIAFKYLLKEVTELLTHVHVSQMLFFRIAYFMCCGR